MSKTTSLRRSSIHLPRLPKLSSFSLRFTYSIFKASRISLAIIGALLALQYTDTSTATAEGNSTFFATVVLHNTLQRWLQAVLVGVTLQLLWKSLLLSLNECQQILSSPSELEERLTQLIVDNLKHLNSWTTQSEDNFIIFFLATCTLTQPPWLYLLHVCLFKMCVGQRCVELIWSLLEIFSQTWWLATATCQDNAISSAQTNLFMNSSRGPFRCLLFFFILNDVASTAGINTSPLFFSAAIGAGVLGASTQSVIKDFVASIHLLYARPFEMNDAIAVEGNPKVMTVCAISYKYTKLKAFDGEYHLYPNHVIANTNIQNFGSLVKRRRIFSHWQIDRSVALNIIEALPQLMKQTLSTVRVADLSAKEDLPASIEFFCGWMENVTPTCFRFEVGYILINTPDFRTAQHRINLAIVDVMVKHQVKLFASTNVAMLCHQ